MVSLGASCLWVSRSEDVESMADSSKFPSAIIATTKLLPKRLHVGGVGFASALGGGGAAVYVSVAFLSH